MPAPPTLQNTALAAATPTPAPAQTIVLGELDRDGFAAPIGDAEASALARTGLITATPERGAMWRLAPAGKVGAARVGSVEVHVRPKDGVHLSRLLFLLGYARDPGFIDQVEVGAQEDPEPWPALAESLARFAERATGRGVLQGYVTREEALRLVRGRIRIGDQIARRPGMLLPVEVRYDDYTADIAENRILRTAIRRMLGVPRLPASAAARLAHVDGRLSEVSLLRPGQPLPTWRQTRLNARYAPALRLAEMVLRNVSAEASASGADALRAAAFVVDMAKVFEDFVGTALVEALRSRPGTTKLQFPTRLDEGAPGAPPAIPMRPDVVHLHGGRPAMVFDAKYKADTGSGYPNADHYQMLAYCTALKVPTSWLVYAGGGPQRRQRVRNTGIDIVTYPLDLARAPKELLAQIEQLARDAWALRSR